MSSHDKRTLTIEPAHTITPKRRRRVRANNRPRRQPKYQVILWDDDDHSYQYVICMMRELFRLTTSQGLEIAERVDLRGRATCITTTLEHAELKRDQIHAYGKDDEIAGCAGSMRASIEPVEA